MQSQDVRLGVILPRAVFDFLEAQHQETGVMPEQQLVKMATDAFRSEEYALIEEMQYLNHLLLRGRVPTSELERAREIKKGGYDLALRAQQGDVEKRLAAVSAKLKALRALQLR